MLEVVYRDERMRFFGYSVRRAIAEFRKEKGLSRKRLGGELCVYRVHYPNVEVVASV